MDAKSNWQSPHRQPKRWNAVLRLYDVPLYRDWAAWLTVLMGVTAACSIGTGKPSGTMPLWLETILATVTFTALFGVFPAYLRLNKRRVQALKGSHPAPAPEKSDTSEATDPGRTIPVTCVLQTPGAHTTSWDTGIAEKIASSSIIDDARTSFQYPIGRAARALRSASSMVTRYDCLIEMTESLVTVLGITSAAWLRYTGTDPSTMAHLRKAFGPGVSLGVWRRIATAALTDSSPPEHPLPGAQGATGTGSGEASLLADLEQLNSERNQWAHGGRPRTEVEATIRLCQNFPTLERAIDASRFLVDARWVAVRTTSYDRQRKDFDVRAEIVMGDHPDFEQENFTSRDPFATETFYLVLPGRPPLELTPFVIRTMCEQCRENEIFYADRIDKLKGASFKSFGRGHIVHEDSFTAEILALGSPTGSGTD